jgi:PKD repeat protein
MKTQVIGAFTGFNNDENGLFATEMIQGESVTLEYYQPNDNNGQPVISISDIAYIFRGVSFSMTDNSQTRGGAAWCMINVNCPEGDDWQAEKKGVVREYLILPEGWVGWCSGSMINNTTWDLTPYVLTAHHCGEGCTPSMFNQWIFYFRFEASTCTGTSGPTNYTMTGCSLKAQGDRYTGSDFALFLLNQDPPSSVQAYWNGWNRTNTPSPSGVGIHHPMGDIKKISTYTTTLQHSQWNNNGVLSHWKVYWAETENGKSIVEEGSSGSPLFDNEHRIVGALSGGPAQSCENPLYSLYGKVYWSWDQMGSLPEQQLKCWLDPVNTGEQYLPGTDGTVPQANFEASDQTIPLHDSVNFTDLSQGSPTEWSWSFIGGTPSSSDEKNPQNIVYNTYGNFTVTLTISNPYGNDSETKTSYIHVDDPPVAAFNASDTVVGVGGAITFTDASINTPTQWHWKFQGGTPSTSFNQNPAPIHYNTAGVYQVKLTSTNDYGSDSEIKDNYITVYGAPVADFTVDSAMVPTGYAVNFTDLSYGYPTSWEWTFVGGTPSSSEDQNPQGIVYNTAGTYPVSLTISSSYGTSDTTKTDFITAIAPPQSNFSCFNSYILVGSSTTFTDLSAGDPDIWQWTFEGGTPETSTLQMPGPIQYNSPGDFNVTLTVGNEWGNTTINKPDYIHAGYLPVANFSADNTIIIEGESTNFTDLSTEDPVTWNWIFEGGTPGTSDEKNPSDILYSEHGTYDVTLKVFNEFGENTKTETDYIYVGGVGIDDEDGAAKGVFVFPNPTTGIVNMMFTGSVPDIRSIEVYNSFGNKVRCLDRSGSISKNIQMDLSGQRPGIYYMDIQTSDQVIIKKISLTR